MDFSSPFSIFSLYFTFFFCSLVSSQPIFPEQNIFLETVPSESVSKLTLGGKESLKAVINPPIFELNGTNRFSVEQFNGLQRWTWIISELSTLPETFRVTFLQLFNQSPVADFSLHRPKFSFSSGPFHPENDGEIDVESMTSAVLFHRINGTVMGNAVDKINVTAVARVSDFEGRITPSDGLLLRGHLIVRIPIRLLLGTNLPSPQIPSGDSNPTNQSNENDNDNDKNLDSCKDNHFSQILRFRLRLTAVQAAPPLPGPASGPIPEPVPEPIPVPIAVPIPEPIPVPRPIPRPAPGPISGPRPVSIPNPKPGPGPNP